MDRLLQDLRHALRMLRRTPTFTTVVILTLGIGIGANTAMFSVVNAVLLEGLPFRDADRVVDLNEVEVQNRDRGAIAPANFVDWRRLSTSFESMAVYMGRTFNVAAASGEPERLRGATTSTTFFDVLGVSPVLGRAFTAQDAQPGKATSVVLGYALWQRRFGGNPNVVNTEIRVNGTPHVIVGVMGPAVTFPETAEFWLPAEHDVPATAAGGDVTQNRESHYLFGVARLKPGVSMEQANAEIEAIGRQLAQQYPDTNTSFVPVVRSLQQQLVGAARAPLLVLLGAVATVLLIVVANVANLLMARATVRSRELSIRAAIGADRVALIRQLLTESVLLSLIGGGLGVFLAVWGVDLILALDPGEVPRVTPITVDGVALTFAFGVSLLTGILFGAVPAWHASRPELHSTLKDATRGTTGDGSRHLARAALVLAEVSLSLMLLVGAGLLFRSLLTLLDEPLGFSAGRVLTVPVTPSGESYRSPESLMAYRDRVVERVRALPGVQQVALSDSLPMASGFSITSYLVSGRPQVPPHQQPLTHYVAVSPSYFATLGVPVLRGREFEARDVVPTPTAIVINEAMARREFVGQDPIGQKFSIEQNDRGEQIWLEIVGVVGNVRMYRADEEPVPMTYAVYAADARGTMNLLIATAGTPAAVAGPARAALQALDPSLPVGLARSLDDVVGASLTQRRFNMTLLMIFAGIAVILAVAGIYGTVAYAVAQRTQEIGIRVALGATGRTILGLMLWDALKPVAAGLVVGLAGAVAFSALLERMVYGISTTDPLTFVALPLLLALVAFVAIWIPAARASRVDPMVALRMD